MLYIMTIAILNSFDTFSLTLVKIYHKGSVDHNENIIYR